MSSSTSASTTDKHPVRVTLHALARARERHGDLRLHGERRLLQIISREVGAALRAGRMAKNKPREALVDERHTRTKGDRERYVWTPRRDRIYIIRRTEGVTLVVTTLATIHSQP